jgi:hypothetical protein
VNHSFRNQIPEQFAWLSFLTFMCPTTSVVPVCLWCVPNVLSKLWLMVVVLSDWYGDTTADSITGAVVAVCCSRFPPFLPTSPVDVPWPAAVCIADTTVCRYMFILLPIQLLNILLLRLFSRSVTDSRLSLVGAAAATATAPSAPELRCAPNCAHTRSYFDVPKGHLSHLWFDYIHINIPVYES